MFKLFERQTAFSYFLTAFVFCTLVYKLANDYLTDNIIDFSSSTFVELFHLNQLNNLVIVVITTIIIFFTGFTISRLFKTISISTRVNAFPAYMFFCHYSIVLSFPLFKNDILVLLFVHFLMLTLIDSLKNPNTSYVFFRIGLVFIISIFISTELMVMFIPILVSINLFGKRPVRDILAFFLGIGFSIYIIFSILYLTNYLNLFFITFNSIKGFNIKLASLPYIAPIILLSIEVLINIGVITLLNINVRKIYSFLSSLVLVVLVFMIFFEYNGSKMLSLMAYVGSFYMIIYIMNVRNIRLKNLLIFLSLLLTIINIFVI